MNDQSISLSGCEKVRVKNVSPSREPHSSNTVNLFVLFIVVFSFFLFTSCGTKATTDTAAVAPGKSAWSFARGGIKIQYTADNMLNVYENEPHTLLLAVYQLNNINAFNSLAQDVDGLKKLLHAQGLDSGVVGVNKIIVQPGEEKTVVLNRAEDARWVGIVAGYYALGPDQVSRLFNIPLITEKKGMYGFRKTESRVGQMTIKLFLGPSAVHEREVVVK
jgi:type VI secretion system VasD/TssJ family lipoprotein